MSQIPWLEEDLEFPDISSALTDPDGLLAAGGDLSIPRLIKAYQQGIFPWFDDDQPIMWWSPNPRCVLFPENVHVSKSLRKKLNKNLFTVTFDKDFQSVIQQCADSRQATTGTWITDDMQEAYLALHEQGIAHSVEVWVENELVGGLYGLALGRCFFGESMFSTATDASKVAFIYLCNQLREWGYAIIDCQVENPHLFTLGAENIPRSEFQTILENNTHKKPKLHNWVFNWRWVKGL